MKAEREVQRRFSNAGCAALLLLPLLVLLFAMFLELELEREPIAPRTASIAFHPVELDAAELAPLELGGAWRLSSDDPAVGGISALAVEPGGLLALSDSGVLISFAKPERDSVPAFLRELPDGPGNPGFKRHRDTEALLADPALRGWWVAFENHDQLWLYDERFQRALQAKGFGAGRWSYNSGIEALAAEGEALLVIPEPGSSVLRVRGSQALAVALPDEVGPVSDAVTLPDGTLLLLERRLTWRGFANALLVVEAEEEAYRLRRRIGLPLGPFDNAEALAVEPLAGGALRLWLMTDDNYQSPLRTLLVALDLPGGAAGIASQ